MGELMLSGTPASPGVALGTAWRPDETTTATPPGSADQERERAFEALAAAAQALSALAESLPPDEAAIIEAGALMAGDPALLDAVEKAIESDGLAAADAIIRATGEYADAIAAIDDETLAARADDVRSLGRRAARLTGERAVASPRGEDLILIAGDLGPADVAEFAHSLAGVALAGGAATAHAAIVARSLGLPMITGADPRVLEVGDGTPVAIDGSSGTLIVSPSSDSASAAAAAMSSRRLAAKRAHELRDRPAVTTDGTRVTVLVNVASREELEVGVRAGAEGTGLVRTELAFLEADHWPTEREHLRALDPILDWLAGRPAVIRVLDFGADKSPPFLHGTSQRGLDLLLTHTSALIDQLRAILRRAERHDVRILLPMVDAPEQVTAVRGLITNLAGQLGVGTLPLVGSMIETPAAAEHAPAIARESDFLSIGTNDLTATTLGADRFASNGARAYHPKVLRSIARSVMAAHDAEQLIEVCGEAASDPTMLPLLIGLGVDELSVGAARVGEVRSWIRKLSAAEAGGLARSALTMDTAEEVEWAARTLASELRSGNHTSVAA